MEEIEKFGIFAVFLVVVFANSLIIRYIMWAVEFFVNGFSLIYGII